MKPEYIVDLKGKAYPTYPGILDEAHEKGLTSLVTELIQVPTKENGDTAIVKATATMTTELGSSTFTDYGDASPANVNSFIATALIRMASTRAKGRALRDAVNVGDTMLEELPAEGKADAQPNAASTSAATKTWNAAPRNQAKPQPTATVSAAPQQCSVHGTAVWRDAGVSKSGKPYAGFWSCGQKDEKGSYCKAKLIAVPEEEEAIDVSQIPF